MKKIVFLIIFSVQLPQLVGQNADTIKKVSTEKNALIYYLNEDKSNFFQVTLLNQAWIRYIETNNGTTAFGKSKSDLVDFGLRRTRIQLLGQVTNKVFIYFQYGQNNFNNAYTNTASNRKFAAFFHDALCEYKVSNGNQLKLGTGLTVMNGLSRFSQPSVSTIMSLDVPVFLQYSVDQIDQFDRRLAVYARGQLGKLDYRVYVANPFPINTNGNAVPAINKNSQFVNTNAYTNGKGPGINYQYGTYLSWNFLDKEGHITPYMTGTYLGSKSVFNISAGGVFQKSATWRLMPDSIAQYKDTAFANMTHLGVEAYLDMPLNKEKLTAINASLGFYHTDYGAGYLRYNGLMNPANGSTATNLLQSSAYGNSFPIFGTGNSIYGQVGIMLPKKLIGEKNGQLMPYATCQYSAFEALEGKQNLILDFGINWLIKKHNAKISIDYQNRPSFYLSSNGKVESGARKSCIICQYQIFI
jgi:hypothetical protein